MQLRGLRPRLGRGGLLVSLVVGAVGVGVTFPMAPATARSVHCPGDLCEPAPEGAQPWSSLPTGAAPHVGKLLTGEERDSSGRWRVRNLRFVDVTVSDTLGDPLPGSWLYGCTEGETTLEQGEEKVEGTGWTMTFGVLPMVMLHGHSDGPGWQLGFNGIGFAGFSRGEKGRTYLMSSSGFTVPWGHKTRMMYSPAVNRVEGTVAFDLDQLVASSKSTRGMEWKYTGTFTGDYRMDSPTVISLNGVDLQDYSASVEDTPMTQQEGTDRCGWEP